MKFETSHEVRQVFLDYFSKNEHRVIPSSSLIPAGDPSLLFTNAGMNQFKDLFLGREKRNYSRAASSQKCMRVGGKHNDLDNVGFTPRHHTFFEMLGNFSFGDYFKDEAIRYGWELCTDVYGLNSERLYASIFEEDDEAYVIWSRNIGLPDRQIVRMGAKDNFWAMGDTGPCGPCSEIYYDQGHEVGCRKDECSPHCECGRYLEFWNLVFMQYNRDSEGNMVPLPSPSIDTGMGLERLAAILKGVHSNYQTDLFEPLFRRISDLSGIDYGSDSNSAPSFRVIADHTRAVAFLIGDGIFPSNDGRGYVLRRLIRRSLRFAHKIGLHAPLMGKLVDAVAETLGDTYPEIPAEIQVIRDITSQEEARFENTLDRGTELIEESLERSSDQRIVSGDELFYLYDTHGIPADFVEELATEKQMTIDLERFNALLSKQRERSKQVQIFRDDYHEIYEEIVKNLPEPVFKGYETFENEAVIHSIIFKGSRTDTLESGQEGEIILDMTTAYAESGGQVGDTGTLSSEGGKGILKDTRKPIPTLTIHHIFVTEGRFSTGDKVKLTVDHVQRQHTTRHHTATHLLHAGLRAVLGKSVKQMGSLVSPDKLRFDFSFSRALTDEESMSIENYANQIVLLNLEVNKEVLPVEEARNRGALAFFGDKYGEQVRIINIDGHSMEFCGGCHVNRTGDIGLIKITSEKAIAAGVRRLEAVAGLALLDYVRNCLTILKEAENLLPGPSGELPQRIRQTQELARTFERKTRTLKEKLAAGGGSEETTFVHNGITIMTRAVTEMDPPMLRSLADRLKEKLTSGIIAIGNRTGEKVTVLIAVTEDLEKSYPASRIAGGIGKLIEGSGGGKPHLAQAGGKLDGRMMDLLSGIPDLLKKLDKN